MHNVVTPQNTARFLKYVWPFYNIMHERVNQIHEKRVLRIVYKDFKLSFQELLKEDNVMNIHHRNLQNLFLKSSKLKISYHLSS